MANKIWKINEIEYIRKMYPSRTTRQIAMDLCLTETQVSWALRQHKIRKKPRIPRDPDLAGMFAHIDAIRKELGIEELST